MFKKHAESGHLGSNLPKHLHVIGICGVATSALAIAFHDRGVKVTGSDKGFFPPVSTELEKHGIAFYAGWHPEKMVAEGVPDAIMVGTASGSANPETIYAKEHGIPLYSYPEIIGKYFVREHSVVCAGTWGKTSSAALLSYILDRAELDPTYMFGGVSLSHESSARLTDSAWNVFEGDEYKSSPTDVRAKFFHYRPTQLLLTAVSWDHADLYPTENDYFNAFKKLLGTISSSGFVVACADQQGVLEALKSYKGKTVLYGRKRPPKSSGPELAYEYSNPSQTKDGLALTISHKGKDWQVRSPLLGLYQSENICGCFAMASESGIPPEKIVAAIASFKGLKRRMEKRLDGSRSGQGVTVIDDIAHSPEKASSVLKTLQSIYDGNVVAVFEPNIGGRERGAAAKYENAFESADLVVVPRLTKLKLAEDGTKPPMEGDELAEVIAQTHLNVRYIEDDAKLVDLLAASAEEGGAIAFLGSHGFRGMIEATIERLKR